jgi:hypothetical protein
MADSIAEIEALAQQQPGVSCDRRGDELRLSWRRRPAALMAAAAAGLALMLAAVELAGFCDHGHRAWVLLATVVLWTGPAVALDMLVRISVTLRLAPDELALVQSVCWGERALGWGRTNTIPRDQLAEISLDTGHAGDDRAASLRLGRSDAQEPLDVVCNDSGTPDLAALQQIVRRYAASRQE